MCMNVYTHTQFKSNMQHCFVYIYRRKSRKQPIKIHLLRFSSPLPLFGFLGRSHSFSSQFYIMFSYHWNHKSYLISPTEILIQCKIKDIELHFAVTFLFLPAWYTHLEAGSVCKAMWSVYCLSSTSSSSNSLVVGFDLTRIGRTGGTKIKDLERFFFSLRIRLVCGKCTVLSFAFHMCQKKTLFSCVGRNQIIGWQSQLWGKRIVPF